MPHPKATPDNSKRQAPSGGHRDSRTNANAASETCQGAWAWDNSKLPMALLAGAGEREGGRLRCLGCGCNVPDGL